MVELVVKSKIREVLPKDSDLRLSVDLPEALNKKIEDLIKKAAERAKANHRTTILPQDV
jgi:histone H3/H4